MTNKPQHVQKKRSKCLCTYPMVWCVLALLSPEFPIDTSYGSSLKTFVTDIKVTHKSVSTWEVTYQFSQAVSAVAFFRQTNKFRDKVWSVSTPDITLATGPDIQYVASKSGKPFKTFTITHPVFTDSLRKDYEFFQKFSDGGLILYTGHYNVRPATIKDKVLVQNEDINVVTNFTFVPTAEEHTIVEGRVSKAPVQWLDKGEKSGTYVYFGQNKPTQHKDIITLTDPGVPKWISKKIDSLLPRLIHYFAKNFDRKLEVRPVVYTNWIDQDKDYMGNAGGTLPSIIQLTMKGKRFAKESEKGTDWLAQFLAHEVSHMWNGQMYTNEGEPWLHEGSADAFAFLALKDLGMNDESKYRSKLTESANWCALDLRGKPLQDARKYGWWHNYYSCGALIALATAHAMQADLFAFWRKLFDLADKKDRRYSDEDYLKLLTTTKSGIRLGKNIGELLQTPQSDPANFVKKILIDAGVPVSDSDERPDYYERALKKMVIRKIMRDDCGFADFGGSGSVLELNGSEKCRTITFSDTIVKIAELDFEQNPIEIYDLILSACKEAKPLVIAFKFHKVTWQCAETELLPARVRPFKLTKAATKK